MPELRNVALREELCARAEEKFGANFATVQELLEFILSDLLKDAGSDIDRHEQEALDQRLKDLGYL